MLRAVDGGVAVVLLVNEAVVHRERRPVIPSLRLCVLSFSILSLLLCLYFFIFFLVCFVLFLPWFSLFESLFLTLTVSLSFICFFSVPSPFSSSPLVFLSGGIYRGKGKRGRPYPYPIMAYEERGHPTLPRHRARWPMEAACKARLPWFLITPWFFIMRGHGLR